MSRIRRTSNGVKHYELTYLIPTELSEEESKNLQERIIALIQKYGGILQEARRPVQQNLAYPIKRRDSAILTVLDFLAVPEKIIEIENKIKSERAMLRYFLAVKKTVKTDKKIPRRPLKKLEIYPKEGPSKEKVELEEIDKKLKEIFGE